MQENAPLKSITLPILTYHELYVKNEEERYCARTMGPTCALGKDTFQKHLELIASKRIKTVTFNDLSAIQHDYDEAIHDLLIITFDDGHLGNYRYAYPLLAEKKMSAVFFVTSNFIDTSEMMDWSQLREMADNGMSIQSHGVSHEPLETLSELQLEEELDQSKKTIEDKIGKEVDTISLPHGSMHRKALEKARNVGYRFVCTSTIDYFKLSPDNKIQMAPRIPVSGKMQYDTFSDIITGDCRDVYKWKRSQKMRLAVRKIIGVNNYRRIYRFVNNINAVN